MDSFAFFLWFQPDLYWKPYLTHQNHTPNPYPQTIPYGFVLGPSTTVASDWMKELFHFQKLSMRAAAEQHKWKPEIDWGQIYNKSLPKPYPIRPLLVDMAPGATWPWTGILAHWCVAWTPGTSQWDGLPGWATGPHHLDIFHVEKQYLTHQNHILNHTPCSNGPHRDKRVYRHGHMIYGL